MHNVVHKTYKTHLHQFQNWWYFDTIDYRIDIVFSNMFTKSA